MFVGSSTGSRRKPRGLNVCRGCRCDAATASPFFCAPVVVECGACNNRLRPTFAFRRFFHRYRPQNGERWPTSPAKAEAIVENGRIKRIVVTAGGSGYNSPPTAEVDGFKTPLRVKLEFGADLKKNGAIGAVEVPAP